jgi:hypothetical protein
MARLQATLDEGDLQIRSAAASKLNMQSQTADIGWSSCSRIGFSWHKGPRILMDFFLYLNQDMNSRTTVLNMVMNNGLF